MRKFVHDQRRLQFSLVVAIALLFAALMLRAYWTNQTAGRLCSILHDVIAQSDPVHLKPGQQGYDYWTHHPAELDDAHRFNQRTLAKLDCAHLPTGH
jgi:hypothetical protein